MYKGINKHLLLLHFIVFIWGFSPILGRFITCGTMQLVWFRIAFTLVIISVFIAIRQPNFKLKLKEWLQLAGIGIIIAIHWLCFYGAIKASNVSVTMAAFSSATLFTSLIEPIFFKRKIIWYEIVIGLIIIAAICLIFSVEIKYWEGIVLGILAALLSSVFSVFNGLMIKKVSSTVISYVELWFGLTGISIYLLFSGGFSSEFFVLTGHNITGLLILAGVCTAFPFIASVNLMKHISPYTISLAVNMETVYGIVLAILIYQENTELSFTFYVGVCIILFAVFIEAILKSRAKTRI